MMSPDTRFDKMMEILKVEFLSLSLCPGFFSKGHVLKNVFLKDEGGGLSSLEFPKMRRHSIDYINGFMRGKVCMTG